MNILLLIPLHIFQRMASVEPILNMVLNKPEEDTLEGVPPSPQPSPPCRKHPETHPPPHVHVADMLKKVQDVESKLSSLTPTKLDLISFLEDITTELNVVKT